VGEPERIDTIQRWKDLDANRIVPYSYPRPKAQVVGLGTGALPDDLREPVESGLLAGEVGDELGVLEGERDAAGVLGEEATDDAAEVGVFG